MSSYNTARSTVREYAGGSVGGILRKGGAYSNGSVASTSSVAVSAGEARQVDLLVFGYACKVFRDDEKARDIDHGKHLIPWMGDTALKIDRYDVRGALSDLAQYEPPPGGYGNRLDYLSAEEQRAEQLCEEERYLYLYNNEEDHILQQEEDLKRLKQESGGSAYNQVAFQYGGDACGSEGVGVPHGPNREEHSSSPAVDEAEEAFSLPTNFEVPASIQLPETMKQHAIIEKTARFIASQGVQMEILLKAKQSNNLQFEFLSQNSLLNPYYKYIVNAIKDGTYPATTTAATPEPNDQPFASTAPASASITATSVAKPVITVPVIKYKPSASCAYTQLISKIKGLPLPAVSDEENADTIDPAASNSPTSVATAGGGNFTPVLLQYNGNTYVTADIEDSNSNLNANVNSNSQDVDQPQVELLVNSSALALAQNYSSDSEEECEAEAEAEAETKVEKTPQPEPVLTFPIPPESLKNIIDKTATYVIKNGRQFEETLRAKSDERFTFLLHENEFYAYYMYKITGDPDAASKEQKQRKAAAVAAALLSKKGLQSEKTISAPVCFSIKSKEEPSTAALQPVLPQEASDDDEEKKGSGETSAQASRTVPEHVQKAIQLVERQLMARNEQLAAAGTGGAAAGPAISVTPASISVRSRFDVDYTTATKTHIKSTKAEMERNALFEQQQQHRQKELKKAEEKVKDKLAQIAREKLGGLISKEKQLQLERKRKAMAFLNQIKGTPPSATETPPTADDEKARPDDEENASDDSDASVHSIPITSYGPEEKTDDEEEQVVRIPQTHIATSAHAALPQPAETAAKSKPAATVTVSDDDDVQLVSESKPSKPPQPRQRMQTLTHKRRSRSRLRNTSATPSPTLSAPLRKRHRKRNRDSSASSCYTHSDADDAVYADELEASDIRNSRTHTHKSSAISYTAVKSKKSAKSRSRKKKSKKRSRSRSRTPHTHSKRHHNKSRRRSGSYSRSYSAESAVSAASQQEHRHADRQRADQRSSQTPTLKRKEKKRKLER